jgi:hypothetical protein
MRWIVVSTPRHPRIPGRRWVQPFFPLTSIAFWTRAAAWNKAMELQAKEPDESYHPLLYGVTRARDLRKANEKGGWTITEEEWSPGAWVDAR